MGKGIEIIQKIDFQSNEDTLKYIKEIRNCVLEDLLVSYDFMKSLHPFLRVGRGESVVDNVGSGGIFANTDAETEIVIMDGVDELGSQYKTHPDTHFQYRGLQIPRWNELLKLEEKLAKVLPTVRFVGFDLALTTKDWMMVEGNNNPQPVLKFNRLEGEVKNEHSNFKPHYLWRMRSAFYMEQATNFCDSTLGAHCYGADRRCQLQRRI